MSTTLQTIDARGTLIGWLKGLTHMYTADINATPEDKWTATFGGCTRPASELTADALSLFAWTTAALSGNGPTGSEEDAMAGLKAACGTREGAVSTLNKLTEEFIAALSSASDEKLLSTVMAPWQMETPLFMMAQITVSHLWYHDGQLNYIHCLLGDSKIHWMG